MLSDGFGEPALFFEHVLKSLGSCFSFFSKTCVEMSSDPYVGTLVLGILNLPFGGISLAITW